MLLPPRPGSFGEIKGKTTALSQGPSLALASELKVEDARIVGTLVDVALLAGSLQAPALDSEWDGRKPSPPPLEGRQRQDLARLFESPRPKVPFPSLGTVLVPFATGLWLSSTAASTRVLLVPLPGATPSP